MGDGNTTEFLNGQGRKTKYLTDNVFRQIHPTKNGNLNKDKLSIKSSKIIWWLCFAKTECGCSHEYLQAVYSKTAGRGCPYCSGRKVCIHQSLQETHPELVKQIHPTKNGTLKPSDISFGSNKIIWWICPKQHNCGCVHEYLQAVYNKTAGAGCPYCSGRKVCIHQSLQETHPELVKQIHPTKNGTLKPSDISFGSEKVLWWICPKQHNCGCVHEYQQMIRTKTCEVGCPYCCGRKYCIHQSLQGTHPELVKQIHPTKNGTFKPSDISFGSEKVLWWICPKQHNCGCVHEYQQPIWGKTRQDKRQSGCPYCSGKRYCIHQSLQGTHPELIKQIHPTKNGTFKATDVSFGSIKKIWWNCLNNSKHVYLQSICLKTCHKSGCPICKHKTAQMLYDFIKQYYPSIQIEVKFNWCINDKTNRKLPFDFYIPELNLLIELDGPQHFIQVAYFKNNLEINHQHDRYKLDTALKNGKSMIRLLQKDVRNNTINLNKDLLPLIKQYEFPQIVIIGDKTKYDYLFV